MKKLLSYEPMEAGNLYVDKLAFQFIINSEIILVGTDASLGLDHLTKDILEYVRLQAAP